MNHSERPFRRLLAGLLLAGVATAVPAQAVYPSKPITLLVGFAPGGGTDLIGRQLAPRLGEILHQPVVLENKAGASGAIAAAAVAKAKPDGYTLLLGHVSSNAMVPAITPKMAYKADGDFTPITLIGSVPQVVVVPASSPARTLREFIALAKERKGGVNYASSGTGTQQHFAAEMFQLSTGTTMTHVPYRGSGAALADLIAGQVDVNFDTVPTVLQQIQAGKLRPLAVTSPTRIAALPEVPTMAEAGVAGYEISAWYMLMGPAGLPTAVRDELARAANKVLALPETRERMANLGTDIAGGTPEQAQAYLRSEIRKWSRLAAEKNIRAD